MCKLCGGPILEGNITMADKNMCKKCYSDMGKYRRWQTQTKALTPSQESEVNRLEKMFRSNLAAGRYVPSCFKNKPVDKRCETCHRAFSTSTGLRVCSECHAKESQYIKLLSMRGRHKWNAEKAAIIGKDGFGLKQRGSMDTLEKYDNYYADLFNLGRRVPRRWLVENGRA
jgi:hypothetical protein